MKLRHGRFATIVSAIALTTVLSGCGGGGNGAAPPTTPPPTYTIGGTVSGLSGTIVLTNNGTDSLSISQDGVFTFKTPVASGGAYAVAVASQPKGQACSISGTTGSASTTVTSVAIICSATNAAYLPMQTPLSFAPSAPPAALYVLSTDALSSAPTLVLNQTIRNLGFAPQFTVTPAGPPVLSSPALLIYTTQNASGGDHVWGLDLTATSALVPRQVGNLAIPYIGTASLCEANIVAKDLTDPASAVIILSIPTDVHYLCAGDPSSIKRLLIHLSDTPDVAAVPLPEFVEPLLPLYSPTGQLTGIVAVDASHNLNFYADETLTNPTVLMSDVGSYAPMLSNTVSALSGVFTIPTFNILAVGGLDGRSSLRRIDFTGTLSGDLYDFQGTYGNGVVTADSSNLYVTDTYRTSTLATEILAQVALDGASGAQILYTYSAASNAPFYLLGETGGKLILNRVGSTPSATGGTSDELAVLDPGSPGTPTVLATFDNGFTATLMAGDIFLDISTVSQSVFSPPAHSTEILRTDGQIIQPLLAASHFLYTRGTPLIQVRGITDDDGIGGGSTYTLDLTIPASPGLTPVLNASGTIVTWPSGTYDAGGAASVFNIGLLSSGGATLDSTLTLDVSTNILIPVEFGGGQIGFLTAP